nr:ATP-binding protein [uncultured Allomuricauda sp.]
MNRVIGKVAATEKAPTTIDEFYFWTNKNRILSPFDVIKVEHISKSKNENDKSTTYGVIEEISHITDSSSYLSNFISNDFGDVELEANMHRIGMNFVKAKVIGNTDNIYTPVLNGSKVSLASHDEISEALGLDKIENKMPCGYLEMYEGDDKVKLPVFFNSHFLIGPEGAHLNISGISGLAAKTSYSMFLMRAIQEASKHDEGEDVAFVFFNVKGRDLLAIDEPNDKLDESQKKIYSDLGLSGKPFENVHYYYPFSDEGKTKTFSYAQQDDIDIQIDQQKAFKYKYVYEDDKENLDLLFANVDDPTGTMDSIINFIISGQGNFASIRSWTDFRNEISDYASAGNTKSDKEITVTSWRKFKRVMNKGLSNSIFSKRVNQNQNEVRISDAVKNIQKNEIKVVDIAKLDQDTQAFVFGDVVRAIYEMKLGQDNRDEKEIPSKIVIFIDELNKYASSDVPKNSPILRQIIDISERGRSLGIILFSVEQFRSAIHDRVKGNCATHAYGRTNAIEISKSDYRYVPPVFKNMMTRLPPGEYILEHPIFRSLLHIKFPREVYKQFKNG